MQPCSFKGRNYPECNFDFTLTDHTGFLPLSRSSADGYVSLPNIVISIVTLIKHLSTHPGALIPQRVSMREVRGGATINLWGPKWGSIKLYSAQELWVCCSNPLKWSPSSKIRWLSAIYMVGLHEMLYSLVAMVLNSHMWLLDVCFYLHTWWRLGSRVHQHHTLSCCLRSSSGNLHCTQRWPRCCMRFLSPTAGRHPLLRPADHSPPLKNQQGQVSITGFQQGYHQFALPWQEASSKRGLKGSFPFWTLYPSWQLHSKLPGRFVHWAPSPHKPVILHSSTSARASPHKEITVWKSGLVQGPAETHPDSGFHRSGWRRPCCWTGCSRSGRCSSSCHTCCGRWCSDRRFY